MALTVTAGSLELYAKCTTCQWSESADVGSPGAVLALHKDVTAHECSFARWTNMAVQVLMDARDITESGEEAMV